MTFQKHTGVLVLMKNIQYIFVQNQKATEIELKKNFTKFTESMFETFSI